MHNAGFEALDLDYVYVAFEPPGIESALHAVRALGMCGASISKPYKEAALAHVDAVDPVAASIGAINTVKNDDGALHAFNSDWIGAVRALREVTELKGRSVAIVGAGGAARAVAYGLLTEQCAPIVYNRTAERGRQLAEALGVPFGGDPSEMAGNDVDIVINATSVGFNAPGDDVPVPDAVLARRPVVLDAVFQPAETAFVARARRHGCVVALGTRMLLHQGAFQFELFTGREAPLEAMERVLQPSS